MEKKKLKKTSACGSLHTSMTTEILSYPNLFMTHLKVPGVDQSVAQLNCKNNTDQLKSLKCIKNTNISCLAKCKEANTGRSPGFL